MGMEEKERTNKSVSCTVIFRPEQVVVASGYEVNRLLCFALFF